MPHFPPLAKAAKPGVAATTTSDPATGTETVAGGQEESLPKAKAFGKSSDRRGLSQQPRALLRRQRVVHGRR